MRQDIAGWHMLEHFCDKAAEIGAFARCGPLFGETLSRLNQPDTGCLVGACHGPASQNLLARAQPPRKTGKIVNV
jgi:hypothetical protein